TTRHMNLFIMKKGIANIGLLFLWALKQQNNLCQKLPHLPGQCVFVPAGIHICGYRLFYSPSVRKS
ncbi:hypothetical protein AGA39_25570, partial [Escherichia coli]